MVAPLRQLLKTGCRGLRKIYKQIKQGLVWLARISVQKSFNEVSRKFKGCLKFEGCFKEVLRIFTEKFKEVPMKFKGCFKNVLRKIEGHLTVVLRGFQG